MSYRFVLIAVLGLVTLFSGSSWAESPIEWDKYLLDRTKNRNFSQPYLLGPKIHHNNRWNRDNWIPQDWAQTHQEEDALLSNFYQNRVISGQYVNNNALILEIGPTFYHLSAQDKNRVVRMVDAIYGITENRDNGIFYLYDHRTGSPIGIYTRYGLQLQ